MKGIKVKLFIFKGILVFIIIITLGIFVCCTRSEYHAGQEEQEGQEELEEEIVMEEQQDFSNPIIEQRADPWVYKHTDDLYYFTASVPEYDRIILRKAETIQGLGEAEEIVIWKKYDSGEMSVHIWAPEIHYLDGKWYIYFSAGGLDGDKWNIRPYVIECTDEDPITGTWIEKGMMQRHLRINFPLIFSLWMRQHLSIME